MPEKPSFQSGSKHASGKELELSFPVIDVQDPHSGESVRQPFPSGHIPPRNDDPPVELAPLPPDKEDKVVHVTNVEEAKTAWGAAIEVASNLDERERLIDLADSLGGLPPDEIQRHRDKLAVDRIPQEMRQEQDAEKERFRDDMAAALERTKQDMAAARRKIENDWSQA